LWVAEVEGMDKAVFHVEHFEVTPSNELPNWRVATKKAKPEKHGPLRRWNERNSQPRPLRYVCLRVRNREKLRALLSRRRPFP
jgi:hypothetical protein